MQTVKMPRLRKIDIVVLCATVILVAYGVWNTFIKQDARAACETAGQTHELTLQNDAFTPQQLTLNQCDILKVINADTLDHELMFGIRSEHVNYPGYTMQKIAPNEFFAVDMIQSGTYTMHDHLRDNAHVELEVIPKK